jgi:hypothetical protein
LLLADGNAAEALSLAKAALAADDKVLGRDHPRTKASARAAAATLDALCRGTEAKALRERYGVADSKKEQ